MAWKLTTPDQFGNYWLATHPATPKLDHPAIFPSKRLKTCENGERLIIRNGSYIAWTGSRFLFGGADFQRFRTPRAALDAINASAGKVSA